MFLITGVGFGVGSGVEVVLWEVLYHSEHWSSLRDSGLLVEEELVAKQRLQSTAVTSQLSLLVHS